MSRAETNGKRTCFQVGGHRTKSGKECGYFVAPGATSCPHHAADKTPADRHFANGEVSAGKSQDPRSHDQ